MNGNKKKRIKRYFIILHRARCPAVVSRSLSLSFSFVSHENNRACDFRNLFYIYAFTTSGGPTSVKKKNHGRRIPSDEFFLYSQLLFVSFYPPPPPHPAPLGRSRRTRRSSASHVNPKDVLPKRTPSSIGEYSVIINNIPTKNYMRDV